MREYFSFNKLNKKRKIWFITYIICSLTQMFIGVLNKELIFIFFGIFAFFVGLDLFHDQASDDIIESYKELLESQRVIHNNTLKMLANAIKKNNSEDLKEIVDFIDEHYGEDDNDDSN